MFDFGDEYSQWQATTTHRARPERHPVGA
jgi:hypothetical protein